MPEPTLPSERSSVIDDHRAFLTQIEARRAKRRRLLHNPADSPTDLPEEASGSRGLVNYFKAEETIRNDYAVDYIISGEWAGNRIKGVEKDEECKESVVLAYPSCRYSYAYPARRRFYELTDSSPFPC